MAAPAVPNLTYEAANNLLPSPQLLPNQEFELAGTGTYVPDWTATSGGSVNYTEGGGHSGQNRLTPYSGSGYNAVESQTIAVANGNYLVPALPMDQVARTPLRFRRPDTMQPAIRRA